MASQKPSCFVATIDLQLADRLKEGLLSQGFELSQPPHTLFAGKKKGVSCSLYTSGKMTVQGKDKDEFIEFFIEPEILQNFDYSHPEATMDASTRIGVDESGKGDVFGPLCVAAVQAGDEMVSKLLQMGVVDSKKLTDKRALTLAKKIKESGCPYHVVKMTPAKYNELYKKFGNLNYLLAWGHATSIESIHKKTGCKKVIVDQFASERVVLNSLARKGLHELDVLQRPRAETDPVVAAASILARAAFLEGLQELSDRCKIELPKGASKKVIAAGKDFVRKWGAEHLHGVAKMHFKTVTTIIGNDELPKK